MWFLIEIDFLNYSNRFWLSKLLILCIYCWNSIGKRLQLTDCINPLAKQLVHACRLFCRHFYCPAWLNQVFWPIPDPHFSLLIFKELAETLISCCFGAALQTFSSLEDNDALYPWIVCVHCPSHLLRLSSHDDILWMLHAFLFFFFLPMRTKAPSSLKENSFSNLTQKRLVHTLWLWFCGLPTNSSSDLLYVAK